MNVEITDLETIFTNALGEKAKIDKTIRFEDIEGWDSLKNLNLILELEDFYKISFTKEEIRNLTSVTYLIEILDKK